MEISICITTAMASGVDLPIDHDAASPRLNATPESLKPPTLFEIRASS